MSINFFLVCLDCTGNGINLGTIVSRKYSAVSEETLGFSFFTHNYDEEKANLKALEKSEEIEHYFLLHANHHLKVTSEHTDVLAKNEGFPRGFPCGDDVNPEYSRNVFLNQPIEEKQNPDVDALALPDYVKKKIEKF